MSHTAPNLVLSPSATVGRDVTFGSNVVVHDNVVIGDGVVVQDNAILGKRPKLAPTSGVVPVGEEPLVIGEGAAVCAGAIVFAAAPIDNDVSIGDRVRIQTNVYITGFSVVEDDVFIGPCAMTTNDDTMNRHDDEYQLRGAVLRRACRVGGGAVLTPGVEIGEEAFIAAGAVVTTDVPPRGLAMGVPARVVRQVGDHELLEQWR